MGLAWVIRDEVLQITSREAADTLLLIRTYPVSDLVRLRDKAHDDEGEYEALEDVLTRVIKPDSWAENGGPGSLAFARGVMVIEQTPEHHETIARFLAQLRQVRKQIADLKGEARFVTIDGDAEAETHARIYAKLKRTVSIDWSEQRLEDCMASLVTEQGLPLEISQPKLMETTATLSTPLTVKLSGVSLQAAVDHVTRPLGLSWVVRDGVLLITSKEDADTYLTTRIYPIPDLASREDATDDENPLHELIVHTVQPDSWLESGGPGDILYCNGLGCLVCVQTREAHEKIEKLLSSLRRDVPATGAPARPAGEMKVRIYRIDDPVLVAARLAAGAPKAGAKAEGPSPEAVAKIVRDLVATESWDAPGSKAYLRSLGDRLIVRQTPRVHREIRALLEKLGVLADGAPAGGGFF
jgi:hypothetical protein